MGLALYFSVAGPLANHITANFFQSIFLFVVVLVLLGSFFGATQAAWLNLFLPVPILLGLGLVMVANKLFNVYGLLTLAHSLSIFMVLLYAVHAIFLAPRENKKFFDLILAIAVPLIVLLLCRGMLQMIIRPFFQSGLILNHNYTSVGLVLGILVPLYFSRNKLPLWAVLPAMGLPLLLGTFFFGEVAAVYLLTLAYTSFVLSLWDREHYQTLSLLSLALHSTTPAARFLWTSRPCL
jgi:hypothetical protein